MHVFCVSGRFLGVRMSNHDKAPGGSPSEEPRKLGFRCVGDLSVRVSRVLDARGGHVHVFFVSGRFLGVRDFVGLSQP